MAILGIAIIVIISFVLIFLTPLHLISGVSVTLDRVLATLGFTWAIYLVMSSYVMPRILSAENDNGPCGEKSWQAQCYDIEKEVCAEVWSTLEPLCRAEIQPELDKLGPTALVGPRLIRCQESKFDKMFKFKRKSVENSSICVPK